MNTRKDNLLESLDEKTRTSILELAANADLTDVVVNLQKEGIFVSVSTLSRFVRRHREKLLLEEGKEMKPAVDQLVERSKEGGLRAGTLEAVRQRLYERALDSRSPEEARLLYAAMVKEEGKLKELELEARRVALAEEQLKLDALVARSKLAGRAKAEVVTAAVAENGIGGIGLGGDDRATLELGGPQVGLLAAPREKEARLMALVTEVEGILNRGGDAGERLLEARGILADGVKELAMERGK